MTRSRSTFSGASGSSRPGAPEDTTVSPPEVTVGSARSLPGAEELVQHPSLHLPVLPHATAVTISTYSGTSSAITVSGVPQVASVAEPWTALADLIWDQLDPALRVALFVTPLEATSFEPAILR